MIKVITYGTYDLLHYGHIRLLERAKALGDYLIVAVTADDFDKTRGKINVQQSLMERIEAVRSTGLADEIIVEEYEGQKIDDIIKYDIDIFTVGSDWVGKFDYLNKYCKVIYLERTDGISSSDIRSSNNLVRIGFVGENLLLLKHFKESKFVNGIKVVGAFCRDIELKKKLIGEGVVFVNNYKDLLKICDAVYIASVPEKHEIQIREAIMSGKHVLVESPVTTNPLVTRELFDLAKKYSLVLMDSTKTAYSTAYRRLLLLVKSGKIGQVVSVNSVCTTLSPYCPKLNIETENLEYLWSGFEAWIPTAILPIYQILGFSDLQEHFITNFYKNQNHYDKFTQINVIYPYATASAMVGMGIKSEGQLIISGTKGYVYVPSPWWKTDYFEIRHENQNDNRRYFYQLDGEGIRYEIVAFVKAINNNQKISMISNEISIKISDVFYKYRNNTNVTTIEL